ncbi:MAG: protease family protein [Mycobacterium sp.]|nr:protease family protein [Mycobacterium sp.]
MAAAGSLLLLTVALCAAAGIAIPVTGMSTVGPPVAALLVAQFVGACGEELGWRWYLLAFLAATIGTSIVLALLHSRGAPDLLVAGLFHFLINIGLLVVLDEESGNAPPEIAFGVAAVVVARCAVTFRYLYLRVR